ncbi:MAG: hypothetical protein JSU59_01510 [Nitrospirota bacterium]|nr:MAG: hypothetical protein JSU59_01510 [Nitrospirota bacterium]
MPNMLAHIGAQGFLTRTLLPKADLKLILLGCFLPDVPWVLARVFQGLPFGIDPYAIRLYAITQASLFVTLFVCGAIAAVSVHPRRVFAILALNVVLHLLLDALQTKWANGVHLFAPFSWEILNFELFWPESMPTYVLTLLGLTFTVWLWRQGIEEPPALSPISLKKLIVSIGLFVMYWILPIIFLNEPLRENNHYVKTLQAKNERVGQYVEFDRVEYKKGVNEDLLVSFADEEIRIRNSQLGDSAQVSVRGRFVDSQTIEALAIHKHLCWFRDGSSYIGIVLLISMWGVAWGRNKKPRGVHET